MSKGSKAAMDNRSRQLNPQDATYWSSRGEAPAPGVSPAPDGGAAQQPAPAGQPQAEQKSGK